MAAEIIQIDNQDLTTQIYSGQDTNLISSFDVNTNLTSGSYIEYFTYDLNQNLLSTDYNFTQYSVTNDGQSAGSDNALSQITFNPEQSLIDSGFDQGSYITYYNFLNKQIGSNIEQLYVAEISPDRTEIRLDSTVLSDLDIIESTNKFIQERTDSIYFLDFYLNFGDNQLIIANNIELDSQDPTNSTILVKLYEPLPFEFDLNSTLWVVTSIEEPISYQVNFEDEPIVIQDTTSISGPNFNLDIKGQVNNSTVELSYADLVLTSLTGSRNQLNSILEEKEIDINIDYTNFSEFIHFSSAQTRLENFYYKVSLIEQYSSSIAVLNNTNSSSIAVGETSTVLENKIDNIITNFDGYDYYLYYSSGSSAWPKTNTEPPYQLATVNSVAVINWFGSTNESSPNFGGIINSASIFDSSNKDYLYYTIPEFLRDDSDNDQYKLFIDMVAQHFDNIWIYYKDVTQKYNADNRLESGISKDIVADAIRDFGIKLYQNNFSNDDLYTAFLGLTPEGGLFPFPNITDVLPTPSGFEYIDTLISASNDYLPLDDVNKSLYKRIYHNLPYLLKSKGTLPGLRALITSYGIPDTILRINEYGGKDKVEGNDWDYWQNEFNYAFKTEGNNFISSSWDSVNPSWDSPNTTPSTLAFRFKTNGLPSTNIPYSQSLWNKGNNVHLVLRYTGSGYTSGSYSGSIANPYNQYAFLDFYPDYTTAPNESSSLYLPFFDGGWWSVMVNRKGGTDNFTLSAANKIYEGGNNGTLLGFYATSSITATTKNDWHASGNSYFASSSIINGATYKQFSGSLQEIRYYNIKLSEESFKDFTMNPSSIEGNLLNEGSNELIFRASLGGELYTGSVSIHPKVTGSWITTSSFTTNSNFNFNSTPTFVPNEEYFFYDQPAVGIRNAVSDKIRLEDNVMPSGDTLSPFKRLAQNSEVSASYTPNTNLLEVAFSPQDEINDDINSSIGYFNIGDFIGDPSFRLNPSTSYPDLDAIRNAYFEKYTKNYDLTDFIRLIKFFDNSLFKMIQNFVPARTSLAAGIVIKQHLLERNRYPQPQMSWSDLDISGTLKPQWNDYEPGTVEHFGGGTGGSLEQYNYVSNTSQSWYETYPTISGSVTIFHDNQDEFYNGEFSGSVILVTTQSLHQPDIIPVNYYNSDENPLINNATEDRKSDIYQDMDYTQGALVPVNFNLLISGSASKAAVQDSNYTTKRHIIPRYEGSKSTSQHINYWTLGDTGTYGKTPTVESLKTSVAYCDWIGGNTPDQMGTSLAHIKYLINADGTVSIPNTTENSLYINQGNFQTGERFKLSSNDVGAQITPYRTIVRGGKEIQPILYTQLGHTPPAWTSSINLYNENSPTTINDNTVNAILKKNLYDNYAQTILSSEVEIGNSGYSNGWSILYDPSNNMQGSGDYYYNVAPITVINGVNLIIEAQFIIENTYDNFIEIVITPYKTISGELLSPPEYYIIGPKAKTINFNYNLTPEADFIATDEFYFTIKYTTTPVGSGTIAIIANGSYWRITQNPIPNPLPPITVGIGSIWNYPTSSNWSQYSSSQAGIIYIPDIGSALNSYYDIPGIKQQSLSGSGFFDIELDWNINVGDEFRFEGREDRTFMVNKIFSPTNQSPYRISNTGSLEIHLNNTIPSASINLDHFVIRRYVDDASGIIFEGLKPNGSTGPYILSPEFVVPELDKSLDQFILDLTQKGLL